MLFIKKQDSGDGPVVELKGEVDENAALHRIEKPPAATLTLVCKGVSRINSIGVKSWRDFFSSFRKAGVSLRFEEVSPALMVQTSFIDDFILKNEIVSLGVPFHCDECDFNATCIYSSDRIARTNFRTIEEPCTKCQGRMTFDEIPEQYFALFAK